MIHWFIYALGGGWGHLNRALSLGRIAVNHNIKVTILTNSPYANNVTNQGCTIHRLPDDIGFNQTCQQVREVLTATNYNCLIIDTFPRGLGGELVDILPKLQHIPRIFVHRDIIPEYLQAKKLREFVIENFDCVLVPGESDVPLSNLPKVYHTQPWLIRNAWELPPQTWGKFHLLKVDNNTTTILICAAGQPDEISIYTQLALEIHQKFPHCQIRFLANHCPPNLPKDLWISHYPGIECIAAADIVVGGAGYNTIYECAALGVPLLAFVFPRLYDRQQKRAKKAYRAYQVQDTKSVFTTIKVLLENMPSITKISYPNGAITAFHIIKQM